jgi:hypothetical protein
MSYVIVGSAKALTECGGPVYNRSGYCIEELSLRASDKGRFGVNKGPPGWVKNHCEMYVAKSKLNLI